MDDEETGGTRKQNVEEGVPVNCNMIVMMESITRVKSNRRVLFWCTE